MAATNQVPSPPTALTVVEKKFIAVRQLLENNKVIQQIQLALPRQLTPDRFLRVALTSLRRTPALLDCDQASLIGSIIQAAQLGLEPDGVLGQAYLIPYKNECQLQVGYRGYIMLGRRTGEVKSFEAHVVHDGEPFAYEYGTEKYLRHRPSDDHESKPITHVYSVVAYTNGGVDFEVMSRDAVEKIRSVSKAPNSPAWRDHWAEMAKKTAMRRLAKRMPMSAEDSALVKAAVLDEMADAGIEQGNASIVESSEVIRAATEKKTSALSEKYGKKNEPETQDLETHTCSKCRLAMSYPVGMALEDVIGEHIQSGACRPLSPALEESAEPSPANTASAEPFDAKEAADKILNHQRAVSDAPTGAELFPEADRKGQKRAKFE